LAAKPQDASPRTMLSIVVHPAIRHELKLAAVRDGMNMPEKLHMILCHELGREDLVRQAPDYAGAR
jgi:hypothetical protein